MMSIVAALAVGLAVGVVVGALGAGGGILSVPILVYLLGQSPHSAAASSLVIVALTAVVSIVDHQRHGRVRIKEGLIFGALSCIGSLAGSRLSVLVDGTILMLCFGALLLCVGTLMIWRVLRRAGSSSGDASTDALDDTPVDGADGDDADPSSTRIDEGARAPRRLFSLDGVNVWALVAAATLTGFLTGFFGVGGGFAVVPMLVLVLKFPIKEASGTSLLIMIIASAMGLLSRMGTHVSVDWVVTLSFAAASMVGGIFGGKLTTRAKDSTLTLTFGGLLLIVAVATLVSTAVAL